MEGRPKGSLRRVAGLFRAYRARVALIFFAVVITSALGVATPLLSKAVFDRALFPPDGNRDLHRALDLATHRLHGGRDAGAVVAADAALDGRRPGLRLPDLARRPRAPPRHHLHAGVARGAVGDDRGDAVRFRRPAREGLRPAAGRRRALPRREPQPRAAPGAPAD